MEQVKEFLQPNRKRFEADPFGYSALAWHKWGMVQTLAGFPVDISKPPQAEDLKSPVLWLTQAHALAEAAQLVVRSEPDFNILPQEMKGVCDSQYCAVALMLVGYSLEICLKAMLIIRKGIDEYTVDERTHTHHRLVELAEFIPDLNPREKSILELLTIFIRWAGRYPDPGSGRLDEATNIFNVSEELEITAKELFTVAARVMNYSEQVVDDVRGQQ